MDTMHTVHVLGGDLTALAAALRLSRLGHRVLIGTDDPRWTPSSTSPLRLELEPVLELPSVWRDLCAKTGRNMEADLLEAGVSLVEAPSAVHDGLILPTERGAQISAVRESFDEAVAQRWTGVLDEADDLWQTRRAWGLERPVVERPTLADVPSAFPQKGRRDTLRLLARELPGQLGQVLADLSARRGGCRDGATLLLADLAVQRVFGRWQLVDADGPTDVQPLLDVLAARLERRGVRVVETTELPLSPDVVIDTRVSPPSAGGPLRALRARRHAPFLAPTVTTSTRPATDADAANVLSEVVTHEGGLPVVTWNWRRGDIVVTRVHDHSRPIEAPHLGPGMAVATWAARPPMTWQVVDGVPTLHAGPDGHGGPEPWARVLAGALATYAVHEHLTGHDVRPTNRLIGAAGRPRRRHEQP